MKNHKERERESESRLLDSSAECSGVEWEENAKGIQNGSEKAILGIW